MFSRFKKFLICVLVPYFAIYEATSLLYKDELSDINKEINILTEQLNKNNKNSKLAKF